MMTGLRSAAAVAFLAAFGSAAAARAASPEALLGSIAGLVRDSSGTPQMGATVLIYNQYDKLIHKAYTNEQGEFTANSLVPDTYFIQVTLASFLPALKRNVVVQPGMKSLLSVSLASIFSSIELVYNVPGPRPLMTEDWKMVLRTGLATRPVLRFGPHFDWETPPAQQSADRTFGETRGLLRVSAGDHGAVSAYTNEPDLGTAFALATSLYGRNQLEVSGNFGYSTQSGAPASGFRTTFTRETPGGMTPEVAVTLRQLALPMRSGTNFLTGQTGAPALRTMSFGFSDSVEVMDQFSLEYGFTLESISFLDRLNYLSPFARLTYDLGDAGSLVAAYFSGAPPAELLNAAEGDRANLQADMMALSMFPRISLRNSEAHVQRAKSYEIGYRKTFGSRTITAAVHTESVTNTAITMVGSQGFYESGEVLPELFTRGVVFNGGAFRSLGFISGITQEIGDHLDVTLTYGNGDVLTVNDTQLRTRNPNELRSNLAPSRRSWAAARVSATIPQTGTRVGTSYQWVDRLSLTPGHVYLTQRDHTAAGFNVLVRQPVPVRGMPWRLEATADLRNLLAQGYVPIATPDGRFIYLMHTPRAVRGGLSFVF